MGDDGRELEKVSNAEVMQETNRGHADARFELILWLNKHGMKDYEYTIRLLYNVLINGRIQHDLRFEHFVKEAELHAKHYYDKMSFDDDCRVGKMIEPE